MRIPVEQIKATPTALAYNEDVGELNQQLGRGVRDFRLAGGLDVQVEYHRSGLDVFFQGGLHARVLGTCSRCLEEYAFGLEHPFVFVLTPRAAATDADGRLTADDTALSFYEGDEIDLTPLVHEQVLLALPTRALCDDACRGLCPRCGTNLNTGSCGCPAAPPDPRLAVLHALARGK